MSSSLLYDASDAQTIVVCVEYVIKVSACLHNCETEGFQLS